MSSKQPNFVSIVSDARLLSKQPNGSNLTLRDLPKFSDFEYNLLLLLSRSVVMSTADEVYARIALSRESIVQKNNFIQRRFFSGFVSCIWGYKQVVHAICYFRRQVLVRALRRLQGGLLISKVYVNALVSVRL